MPPRTTEGIEQLVRLLHAESAMVAESMQWGLQALMRVIPSAAQWTLQTGLEAAVIALLVLIAQYLLRDRISARWRHNLWLLVLARLVLPPVHTTTYSPFNYLPQIAAQPAIQVAQSTVVAPAVHTIPAATKVVRPAVKAAVAKGRPTTATMAKPQLIHGAAAPPMIPPPVEADAPPSHVADEHDHAAPPEPAVAVALAPPAPAAMKQSASTPAIAASSAPPPSTSSSPSVQFSLADILALSWAAVAAILLLRIAWISVRLAWCVRRLPCITDGAVVELLDESVQQMRLRRLRRPRMRLAPAGCGPAVVGVLRPTLLLPQYLLERFSREELRDVLLHELAHIRRHDVAVNWALCVLRAVHWFNPILWLVGRRIVLEREQACDQAVLAAKSRASAEPTDHASPGYGATLIKLMELLVTERPEGTRTSRQAAAFVGMVGVLDPAPHPGRRGRNLKHLQRRLTMIARFDPAAPSRRRWVVLSTGLTLLIGGVAFTGAVRAQALPPTAPPIVPPPVSPAGNDAHDHGESAAPPPASPLLPTAPPHAGPGAPPPLERGAPGQAETPAVDPAVAAEQRVLELELKAKITELGHLRAGAQRMREQARQGTVSASEVDRYEIDAARAEAEVARAELRIEQFRAARMARPVTPLPPGSTVYPEPTAVPGTPGAAPSVPQSGVGTPVMPPGPAVGAAPGVAVPGGPPGSVGVGQPGGGGFAPGAVVPNPPAQATNDIVNIVEDEATRIANAAAEKKLHATIGKISMDNLPLGDALTFIANNAGVDVLIDWQRIEGEAGVNKDSQVNLKLSGQFPAEHVLRWILRSAAGDTLGYWVDQGVVTVTTQENLKRFNITRAYDLGDPGSLELMKQIKSLVAPDSWRETGGLGGVVILENRALVTQSEPNHRQIEKLLSMVQQKGTTRPAADAHEAGGATGGHSSAVPPKTDPAQGATPADRTSAAATALCRKVPGAVFAHQTWAASMQRVFREAKVPVEFDVEALKAAHVDPARPIDAEFGETDYRGIIASLSLPTDREELKVGAVIVDGTAKVSSYESLKKQYLNRPDVFWITSRPIHLDAQPAASHPAEEHGLVKPVDDVHASAETAARQMESVQSAAKLYQDAIALEWSDPAQALAAYKKIQQLRPDAEPVGLTMRIQRVEDRLSKVAAANTVTAPEAISH